MNTIINNHHFQGAVIGVGTVGVCYILNRLVQWYNGSGETIGRVNSTNQRHLASGEINHLPLRTDFDMLTGKVIEKQHRNPETAKPASSEGSYLPTCLVEWKNRLIQWYNGSPTQRCGNLSPNQTRLANGEVITHLPFKSDFDMLKR